jgi:iron complex transport system substrate-binding protein
MKILSSIFSLFLFLGGCGNAPTNINEPNEIKWIANQYAQLFEIGTTPTDTFIKLYTYSTNNLNEAPQRTLIGSFFWGKSQKKSYPTFAKITKRNRFILLSTVFSRFFVELKQSHRIVGVDQSNYLSSSAFPQKNKLPSVQPFGEIMSEAALKLNPDLVVAYFIGNHEKTNLLRLQSPQTQVLFCQAHLETHPLGRAEWINLFALLTQSQNPTIFSSIVNNYQQQKKTVLARSAPTVMINLPYSGTWDVPKSNSYLSILLKDAKCTPVWLENQQYQGTGSAQIGLETGFKLLQKAEFWINPGMCGSINCIVNSDKRIENCPSIKNKKVFQCDLTLEADGANEYWDLGAVHPDYVLSDFIRIFHENSQSNHQNSYYFYRKLP